MHRTQTKNLLYEQVLCILQAVKVPYIDCHGHLIGDCSTCAGSGEGEVVTNSLAFNPSTNTITSVVNGIASSTEISANDSDVTISGTIVVGGNTYGPGTSIQTILTALSVSGGTAVTVTDSPEIDFTLSGQNITAKLAQQGAGVGDVLAWDGAKYTPTTLPPGSLPIGVAGDILAHDGTNWVSVSLVINTQTGFTGTTFSVPGVPLSYMPFKLYSNGVRLITTQDYTRAGNVVTMVIPIVIPANITAEYYI